MLVAADVSTIWRLDATRRHSVRLRGPARRLLALDAQDHVLLDILGSGEVELPWGTVLVVVEESSTTDHPRDPVGWSAGSRLRQVGSHLAVGDGLVVRTQAPRPLRAPGRGRRTGPAVAARLATGADHVRANRVCDRDGLAAGVGWVDTLLPATMRSAVVTLEPTEPTGSTGPGGAVEEVGSPPAATIVVAPDERGRGAGTAATTTPRATARAADGSQLLLIDLATASRTTHLFVTAHDGWRLAGVTALAVDATTVLRAAAATSPAGPTTTTPTTPASDIDEPTLVVWS